MSAAAHKGGENVVLAALRAAAKGLVYPSESDRPVKALLWKGTAATSPPGAVAAAVDEAALRGAAGAPADAVVKPVPLDQVFGPVTTEQDWFGQDEKEAAGRFGELRAVLQQHLTGLQAFRVEGAHADDRSLVDVYVLGRTPGGDLAGVLTQLVET